MAEPAAPKRIERLYFALLFSDTFIAASGNAAMQSVWQTFRSEMMVNKNQLPVNGVT
jgi:hypothetical protein